MILVDSSIWIEAWRGKDRALIARLSQLVEAHQATLNLLIRTELLQGAQDRKHQLEIDQLLSPISVSDFPNHLWDEAPRFYLKARTKGITLTTMDCLIATHAKLSKLPLWSRDKVFEKLSEKVSIKLF